MKTINFKSGFTLIELLVATTILGVVMVLASTVFATIVKNTRQAEAIGKMKNIASSAQEIYLRQVRASIDINYDPLNNRQLTITDANGVVYIFNCTLGDLNTDGSITYRKGAGSATNMVAGYKVESCRFNKQSVVYTFEFSLSESNTSPQKQEFKSAISFQTSAVPGQYRK